VCLASDVRDQSQVRGMLFPELGLVQFA
jgi:hypothetical protein